MFQRYQKLHGYTFGLNRVVGKWVAYRSVEDSEMLYADSEREIRRKIKDAKQNN